MNQFDRLATDLSPDRLISQLTERKFLLESLLARRLQLKSIIDINLNKLLASESQLKESNILHLRINKCKNTFQYYLISKKSDPKGKYLPLHQQNLAKLLVQRDYNENITKKIVAELSPLKKFLQSARWTDLPSHYESLHPGRKSFITPALQSTEEFAADWQATPYKKNDAWPERLIFKTNRGDMVRSKSEVTIANELFQAGIPYKYEPSLFLEKGRPVTLHPDFIVLNPQTRREIIWEHFGLMDDPEYSVGAVQKMTLYQQNSYFPGKNLIVTMETKNSPLTSIQVRQIIRQYF